MEEISFEKLPQAVSQIIRTLGNIESLLLEKSNNNQPLPDRWFDMDGFREYHPDNPTRSTVYRWASRRKVPCHRDGKKLRFLKSEIDNWLMQGRKKTYAETALEADRYLANKGRRVGK